MKKRKTNTKKPSVASILGLILLGLVLVGVVANVIKSNPKEEDNTEYLTATVELGGYHSIVVQFEYLDGWTWNEIVEHNDLKDVTGKYSLSVNADEEVVISGEDLTPQGGSSSLLAVYDEAGAATGNAYTQVYANEIFDIDCNYSQLV